MNQSTGIVVENGMDWEEAENKSTTGQAASTLGPYYKRKKKIKAMKSLS